MTPLLIAVRRSAGVYAFPVLVILEVVNALARDREYAVEWLWSADWSGAALILTLPIAGGVAAAESITYRRRGVGELIDHSGSRPGRVHLARVWGLCFWVVASHVVGVTVCAGIASRQHDSGHFPVLLTLPAFLMLISVICLGAWLGWSLNSLFLPPLLAVLLYGISTAGWFGTRNLLSAGGATVSLLGLRYRPEILVGQAVWATCLAGASLAALSMLRDASSWSARAVPVLSAGIALATGVGLVHLGTDRVEVGNQPPQWACAGQGPQVCVVDEYSQRLPAFRHLVEPLVRALADLEPGQEPRRVEQRIGRPGMTSAAQVGVRPQDSAPAQAAAFDLARWISRCPADDEPSEETFRLAAYLERVAFPTAPNPYPPGLVPSRAAAREMIAASRHCT